MRSKESGERTTGWLRRDRIAVHLAVEGGEVIL